MKRIISSLILFWIVFPVNAKTISNTQKKDSVVVSNDHVDYKVTLDNNNLYLDISTTDHGVIMSMLHSGITVFFDIKGKKKKNVYVKYPLRPSKPKRKREEKNTKSEFDYFEDINKQDDRIVKLIEDEFPQQAEYKYFDSKQKFNILLNRLDISAMLNYNRESKVFNYQLKIPKFKINSDSKKDLSKLMIGIKTNSMEKGEKGKNKPSLSFGGRDSGGQGGGQRGSGKGGQRNESLPSDRKTDDNKKELKFWFMVNL